MSYKIPYLDLKDRDTIVESSKYRVLQEHTNADLSGWLEFPDDIEAPEIIAQDLIKAQEGVREVAALNIKKLVTDYTLAERETWHIQETEARAYNIDNTSPTPMLSALALASGVTLDSQVAKVLEKSNAFKVEVGRILGEQKKALSALSV